MAEAGRAAFQQITGTSIPVTERSEVDGRKGWARAALKPTSAKAPLQGEQVILHDQSIAVSVVFEPDTVTSPHLPPDVTK
jgi:hypothetical protein